MTLDPLTMAAIVGKAAKTAGVTATLLGGAAVAQTSLPEFAGNLGLVALLAVLVARYTFRQLEAYRQDLTDAHGRATSLRELLEAERVESHRLSVRLHELEDHLHRLNIFITSSGLTDAPELPPSPASSPNLRSRMVATQTLRTQYASPFITGFVRSGSAYGRPLCNFSQARTIVLLAAGAADRDGNGRITLKIHPLLVDSFLGLASVFHLHGYAFRELAGGTLACRNIGGSAQWRIDRQVREQKPWATSLHIGQALDINPSKNRYTRSVGLIQWGRQTDLPKALIRDVEAIKTKAGKRALEWGGRWWNVKDAMHFENDLTRSELAVGIDRSTIKGLTAYLVFAGGGDPPNEEEHMLKRGDKGKAVADHQAAGIALGYDLGDWPPLTPAYPSGADGSFGGDTEAFVVDFRGKRGIPGDTIDGLTSSLIFEAAHVDGEGVDAYTKTQSNSRFATKAHPHDAKTTIS